MVFPGHGVGWKRFFVELKNEWTHDQVGDVAGALTFFSILAVFPFLIFLVSLASLIIDPALAEQLTAELSSVAPPEVTTIVGGQLQSLARGGSAGLLTIAGVGAIWSASGGVSALIRALNRVYGVEDNRPYWKVQGLALLGTLVGAAIGLLAALVAVFAPVIADGIGGPAPTFAAWARLPVAGLLMMFVWALAYWALPDVEQKFRFITPGSVIGVLIWIAASWGFSVYVQNFGKYEATYGALAGVVVLLFWMWITSQMILLGAEVNAILEHLSPEGKRAGAKTMRETGVEGTKGERREQADERRMPAPGAVGPAVPIRPIEERARAGLPAPARRDRRPSVGTAAGSLGVALAAFFLGRRFAR
jgi:membrane protein